MWVSLREGYTVKFFFQSISWNTVSGSFQETWNTFLKYFCFSIQHSLRMFLINKKIVFVEKRYRVKFSSIKKYLLLTKQKQKKFKTYLMKPCSKTRSGKSACANIFLELPLTNSGIILEWMQHMLLIIHWLLYTDYLKLHTFWQLQFWHSRRSRIHKQPPEVLLKILQVLQENTCAGVSFLQSCKPSGLQRY